VKSYFEYVSGIESVFNAAKAIGAASMSECLCRTPDEIKGRPILMIMPHPDDEMIVGALPLRFLNQCARRVVNLSVTLGRNRLRQQARYRELEDACEYIGFEAETFGEHGLEGITPDGLKDASRWALAVDSVADLIDNLKPEIVFLPHEKDGNKTHMGVHLAAMEALKHAGVPCHLFETEFWAAMEDPNLVVESSVEDVARLVSALSLHKGEVARSPYHLRLPAWMIDNVRRGAELVGGQGGAAPNFTFATLYRHSYFDGKQANRIEKPVFLATDASPDSLLDEAKN